MGGILIIVITAAILTFGWFRHRERMMLIGQGIPPSQWSMKQQHRHSNPPLFLGVLGAGIGAALLVGLPFTGHFSEEQFTAGLVCLFSGAAMILFWRLTGEPAVPPGVHAGSGEDREPGDTGSSH